MSLIKESSLNVFQNLPLTVKNKEGYPICIEIRKDGYVNATKMCKDMGRKWKKYIETKNTSEFLVALSEEEKISIYLTQSFVKPEQKMLADISASIFAPADSDQSIKSIKYLIEMGINRYQNTFVHPEIAIHLAQWCSPIFGVAVTRLVRRYLSGQVTTEESQNTAKLIKEYEQKLIVYKQKSIEDKNLLEQNEQKHIIDKKYEKHRLLLKLLNSKRCVYVAQITDNLIKVGSSKDIHNRSYDLNTRFGNFVLLDVFECDEFRDVETNFFNDPKIKARMWKELVNGEKSKEIVHIDENFSYVQLIKVLRRHLNHSNFLSPAQKVEMKKYDADMKKYDADMKKYEIIEKLLETGCDVNTLTALINSPVKNEDTSSTDTAPEEIEQNLPEYEDVVPEVCDNEIPVECNVKTSISRGPRVQKIDPANLSNLVKVFDSKIEAIRETPGSSLTGLKNAVLNHTIYKDFRWTFIPRDQDAQVLTNVPETVENRHDKAMGLTFKVNAEKTEILDHFQNQTIVANALKHSRKFISKIVSEQRKIGDFYYMKYEDCSSKLVTEYEQKKGKLDLKVSRPNMKKIQQLNPTTQEIKIFDSMASICKLCKVSHATIRKAIDGKYLLQGFLWSYV